MKNQLLFLTFVSIITFFCSFTSSATLGAWEKLGTRRVDRALDHDVIMVTRMEGSFTKLKFIVRRSGINMHKIVIHYANGDDQVVETRHDIAKGGESRVIDLAGNKRVITKVDFWYDTKGGLLNDKAVIELWGKH